MIENGRDAIVDLAYFAAAICFIIGLKFLSTPNRARRGNQIAAAGMAVAIVATFISREVSQNYILIIVGIIIGAGVSSYASRIVKMTAMPQMVAIFNGMGGGTAALVSVSEFSSKPDIARGEATSIVLGVLIGSISFSGSLIAFLKLQEMMSGRPITFPNQKLYNLLIFAGIVVLGIAAIALGDGTVSRTFVWLIFFAALLLGA
ncbi:MAG TPA: NAD(P)(+) transhydrogenase (Re/Si-specific) subunit beta, partial [Thermomicrobiales bacterium]|nr:NAD(P)(+) transhydrogenase (Re/Si-specific) subunit beta [Thermomicrobiales bacterium]